MIRLAFISALALALAPASARADTNAAFILSAFPHCKSAPVFSPYAAGAIGPAEAKLRAEWFREIEADRWRAMRDAIGYRRHLL